VPPSPVPPTPSGSGKVLKTGSVGPEVQKVQMQLNTAGIAKVTGSGPLGVAEETAKPVGAVKPAASGGEAAELPLVPDGEFGRKTRGAVRAFQSENGLLADGKVGKQTRAALAEKAFT
jgi:peptidoglycan hydrolase-like protein with peptidoglycan-binding domain